MLTRRLVALSDYWLVGTGEVILLRGLIAVTYFLGDLAVLADTVS